MGTATSTFVDALRQYRLLDAHQFNQLSRELQGRTIDPKALAKELLRRGWLTAYQVNQLLQDRAQDLSLGSYVLLERLGEGGMGQVFKARNWKLGQIVALKVIRPERMANAEVLRRFHREIRLASQLQHPNIVRAFDADQVGSTHLMVMEYVEGTDLSRLVKQSGPLPLRQACDYIRQAALGLQYVHERGMVHRDIKPSNLLVSVAAGTGNPAANTPIPTHQVRILDLGVARLDDAAGGDVTTDMTVMGCIVGTPDFMSPEQARDSHGADIRSDLYSLGCTLYFLLSGQVPFPGGTGTEKLLQHHMEEPRPVEQLRPEVSPGLAAVLRKLMAKRPEDRYQTPAEAAAALSTALADGRMQISIKTKVAVPPEQHGAVTRKIPILRRPRSRRRLAVAAALGLVVLLGGVAVAWVLLPRHNGPAANPSLAQGREPVPQTPASTKATQKATPPELRFENPPRDAIVLGDGSSRGIVYALAASGNGQVLASGGADNAVHLWNAKNWHERSTALRGHTGEIHALAITTDGKTLASGSADQTIKLWDVASARELGSLKGHAGTVRSLAFSGDGSTLASGADGDASLRLWDVPSRQERAHEGGVHALAFAADGQTLASAGADRAIRLWDMGSKKEMALFKGHTSDVISLAYAADGKRIASGTTGGVLRVWNPATQTGHRLKTVKASVMALAFSPDGKRLAAAGLKGTVTLWDVDTENRLQEWTFSLPIHSLVFCPNGYLAAGTAGGTIQVRRPDSQAGK